MASNPTDQYRGIYGITATPFNEDETLDIRSLESVINFSVENGCHGIVCQSWQVNTTYSPTPNAD